MHLKVGIDGRLLDESGIGRYIRNLIVNLSEIDKENKYYIFLLRKDFTKLTLPENFFKVEANVSWYTLREQTQLPQILNKFNLDLVHFPHFNVPVTFRGRFVVTIHDLIHQHFQMKKATTLDPFTYKIKQLGYKLVFKTAIKNAVKILVPSNFIKGSLTDEWKVEKEKIVVTHEAVDDRIFTIVKIMKQNKVQRITGRFKVKDPFIFYIGNAHPHKNVEGLIETFLRLRENYQDLKLVLAGKDHYFWQRIKNKYADKDIKYTGIISDEEMVAFYKGASCFVMPSFEEGFGIPLLEAFACGCPVVASDIGALREVGQDAAFFFDPGNKGDMGEKIDMVLKSDQKRRELIEKGRKVCKEFSWEKMARQTLEVYKQVINF